MPKKSPSSDPSTFPSIYWEKFFNKFPLIETTPIENWDNTLLIAYFCKRYQDHYKLSYTFKFNANSPSKSYEIFQFNKLKNMLSADPTIIKNYIDWWVENKVILKKKKITSMAFLVDANVVNDYKFNKMQQPNKINIINRSSTISDKYLSICKEHGTSVSTYGELAFLKKCKDDGNAEQKYIDLLDALLKDGLDLDLLDRVK